MARLPQPGGDDGNWGEILNDYLGVSHDDYGAIRASAIAQKADNSSVVHINGDETIGGNKTFSSSPSIPSPSSLAHAASKSYVDTMVTSGVPSATTQTFGIVQLAGDLGGINSTAAAPQLKNIARVFNVKDYGAYGDSAILHNDTNHHPNVCITTGSTVLTATAGTFSSTDVGKQAHVTGAAATGSNLITVITSYQSSSQVTLADAASTTATNTDVVYGHDDTMSIQNAMSAATPTGGTVFFPPGGYLISSSLTIAPDTNSPTPVLAPSLIGATGRPGPSEDMARIGVVHLIAGGNFPIGEYLIEYIGPVTPNTSNTGFTVSGFVIDCNARAAGVRSFNSFDSSWKDLVVSGNPAMPNPGNAIGNPTAAVDFSANPSYNACNSYVDAIYVSHCANDGFRFMEGAGSFQNVTRCQVFAAGGNGYVIGDATILNHCQVQQSCSNPLVATSTSNSADFFIRGYCTLTNCMSFNAKPFYGNGISFQYTGIFSDVRIVGCRLYGTNKTGLTEKQAAIVNIGSGHNQHISFTGCTFITGGTPPQFGTVSTTSDYVYVQGGATGNVTFENCTFDQIQNGPLSNVPANPNGTSVLAFNNCPGLNPNICNDLGNYNGRNEVQALVIAGNPSGGTYALTFQGQTTVPLAYNAQSGDIQTALSALSTIGSGNVNVFSNLTAFGRMEITFQGALALASQPLITTANNLTGGASPTVTVSELMGGGAYIEVSRLDGNWFRYFQQTNLTLVVDSAYIKGDVLTLDITPNGFTTTWPSNVTLTGSTVLTGHTLIDLLWNGANWVEKSRSAPQPLASTSIPSFQGEVITVPTGGNNDAVTINQNDTVNNKWALRVVNLGTGIAQNIQQTGNGTALAVTDAGSSQTVILNKNNTGTALTINRNQSNGIASLVAVNQNNTNDPQDVIHINSSGTGAAINVNGGNFNVNGSGAVSLTALKLPTSPTNGYVLTSDSSGNGRWAPASQSQVTKGYVIAMAIAL